jgi:hypothetical protein
MRAPARRSWPSPARTAHRAARPPPAVQHVGIDAWVRGRERAFPAVPVGAAYHGDPAHPGADRHQHRDRVLDVQQRPGGLAGAAVADDLIERVPVLPSRSALSGEVTTLAPDWVSHVPLRFRRIAYRPQSQDWRPRPSSRGSPEAGVTYCRPAHSSRCGKPVAQVEVYLAFP